MANETFSEWLRNEYAKDNRKSRIKFPIFLRLNLFEEGDLDTEQPLHFRHEELGSVVLESSDSEHIAAKSEIERIVFLHAFEKQVILDSSPMQMVHYTSADVAFSIIRDRKIWMRNAIAMNDYSEIEYGERCLKHAWQGANGQRLKAALATVDPKIVEGIETDHDQMQNLVRFGTYLTCFSEHNPAEDLTGRLSMWRAYGGENGVALVIDKDLLPESGAGLCAYSSPVAYLTLSGFDNYVGQIAERLEASEALLRSCNSDTVRSIVLRALRFAVLSTKHPGFREEAEWRVIYTPDVEASNLVDRCHEVIHGVPQVVYKIPIRNPQIFKRVIIGPTKFPRTLRDTFVDVLTSAGVPDSPSRVYFSNIPLRR